MKCNPGIRPGHNDKGKGAGSMPSKKSNCPQKHCADNGNWNSGTGKKTLTGK